MAWLRRWTNARRASSAPSLHDLRVLRACATALALAMVAFILLAAVRRPDGPVEAELLFEASRVAHGRPLYVDPSVGAWEDGGPPSRFYVLYTPIWPWLLAHLAGPAIPSLRAVGRATAFVAWLALAIVPVVGARRGRRDATAVAVSLATAVHFLARFAAGATPDTLAVALECVALVLAGKRGRIDARCGALLAAAPFVKPSSIGAVAGAAVACLASRDRAQRSLGALGAMVLVASMLAIGCQVESGGAWLVHLVRSTAQPLTWARWCQETTSRALVLGAPHLVVLAVALRRRAPLALTAPLAASMAWTCFALAKHGSGTQYWLEPTMAAVVTVAFMPTAPQGSRTPRASPGADADLLRRASAVLLITIGATSITAVVDEVGGWRSRDSWVAAIARHCDRGAGEVVASSDVGLELALDGRLLVPTWQASFLARRGAFPAEAWRDDLGDPHVRWLVLSFDPAQPALDTNDQRVEVSAFRDLLRTVVDRQFVRDTQVGPFVVFRRRSCTG